MHKNTEKISLSFVQVRRFFFLRLTSPFLFAKSCGNKERCKGKQKWSDVDLLISRYNILIFITMTFCFDIQISRVSEATENLEDEAE